MSYLVLARKYRPQTFDDLVGQEHVTTTLRNAIRTNRVHHAFLFTGARGVGKTSAARILAKALNCVHGPTESPCGQCDPCREIASAGSVDVFEIDGASNRGIAEIRELRDGIGYAPSRDRFKIYIIDEVHMLTPEAFNALLKTLEEPPAHAFFIFATTEPHRIPLTILSRCQRFDFKRIPLQQVAGRLDAILQAEGLAIEAEGLRLIAREGEGSMRDAVSLLDQVIAFAGSAATTAQVVEILGVADRRRLLDLLAAILRRDAAAALGLVAEVHEFGVSLAKFAEQFLQVTRDLLVLRACAGDVGLTDLPAEEAAALLRLGDSVALEDLQRLLHVLLQATIDIAASPHPRVVLESALVRITHLRPLVPVERILERVAELEQALATGALPDALPLRAAGRLQPAVPPAPAESVAALPAPAAPPAPTTPVPAMAAAEPRPPSADPPTSGEAAGPAAGDPAAKAAPEPPPDRPATPPTPALGVPEPPPEPPTAPAEPPTSAMPAQPSTAPASAPLASPGPEAWDGFVRWARASNRHRFLVESLGHAVVRHFTPSSLELGFVSGRAKFLVQRLKGADQIDRLTALVREYFGVQPALSVVELAADATPDTSLSAREENERQGRQRQRRQALLDHPIIQETLSFFGGRIADVRLVGDADEPDSETP